MQTWVVSFPDRLDQFLAKDSRLPSRAKAQTAIEGGHVSVNGETMRKSSLRLQEGDTVSVSEHALSAPPSVLEPCALDLPILYEDACCFVLSKPAGIAVHPGAGMESGERTILHGLAHLFAERGLPFSDGSVLAHRLDKDTTGCLLIAKSSAAHAMLQHQFEVRTIEKTYLALVCGVPENAEAMIDAPVGRSSARRTEMTVLGAASPRDAKTSYRTIDRANVPPVSLLSCDLHTGRTHQIRVHLKAIGHPILGDETYRTEMSERITNELSISFLCLHAWKIRFTSPADQEKHAVVSPIPKPFLALIERLGMSEPPDTISIAK